MPKPFKYLLILFALFFFGAQPALADVYVNGYHRKDGTYVQPHYRSDPDGNRFNNFSTRGNVNPYTGKAGSVDPYGAGGGNSYSNPYAPSYQNPYNNNGWGQ